MIKKLISVAFVAAIAAVAAWNMSENRNEVELSDLALDNVEALAYEENGGGRYCQWDASNKYCTRTSSGPVCLLTSC